MQRNVEPSAIFSQAFS